MNLPDALLNAKKYINEPRYNNRDKMWVYERYANGRWNMYYFATEEAAWTEFYKQFRAIKESLMQGRSK